MKVLVVVDMQNDFIDGALGTKEAAAIVPKVVEKVQSYRDQNQFVIFTRDTHSDDYLHTLEGKNLPVPHCIEHTQGWKICDALRREDDCIVNKTTFGSWDLPQILLNELSAKGCPYPEAIELIGLCTDICVISNALLLKARFPEVPISVDASCCAGVTPASHKTALDAMRMCQIQITEA